MKTELSPFIPSESLLRRVRLFIVRTRWHAGLMEKMIAHALQRLQEMQFPPERVHIFTVSGSFELPHLVGAILRHYTWKRGFAQVVSVRGPTHVQSNLRLPPFFQGNFDSHLRSEFLLESPGPIAYFQPYEPDSESELPAILALGCILKGETQHNYYLSQAVLQQLCHLNTHGGIPIILGVLTPDTIEQAYARAHQAASWVEAAFLSWEARLELNAVFSLRTAANTESSDSPDKPIAPR
ncbi:MAG: 6,7-dimethyl-8-ribityllumazine synthase [Bacteroidia bacterium]|nr:6,7-dimethyl-8-ribityllumazine synthase [Bacteroidia bacterium]MDW8236670.1 6,7-dimethyl-8-ribityllumazine synthase [Bacteroidia bacterium]